MKQLIQVLSITRFNLIKEENNTVYIRSNNEDDVLWMIFINNSVYMLALGLENLIVQLLIEPIIEVDMSATSANNY